RALLPIALLAGGPFRLYYTPYPSLNMTREAFQAMLEDLAFGKPLRSTKLDYSGQLTPELLQSEYQRGQELSADPRSTLGLVRPVDARGQGWPGARSIRGGCRDPAKDVAYRLR